MTIHQGVHAPRKPLLWVVAVSLVVAATGVTALLLTAPAAHAIAPELQHPRDVGVVVFVDANANDRLDEGEKALTGARLSIVHSAASSIAQLVTNEHGNVVVNVGALAEVEVRVEVVLPPPAGSEEPVTIFLRRTVEVGQVAAIGVRAEPLECETLAACPDLLLPDLISVESTPSFLPDDLRASYPGTDTWYITANADSLELRLATSSANVGEGPLILVGAAKVDDTYTAAVQRLVTARGEYFDVPAGNFEFDDGHDHVHLQQFQEFGLRSAGGDWYASSKISFCITDVFPFSEQQHLDSPVVISLSLFECGVGMQGLNAGMVDYYGASLYNQYINLDGVPPGLYALDVRVDPDGQLVEASKNNNSFSLPVCIPRLNSSELSSPVTPQPSDC